MASILSDNSVNDHIVKILSQFPANTRAFALKAIELSEEMTVSDVLEVLRGSVKDYLIEKSGGQ